MKNELRGNVFGNGLDMTLFLTDKLQQPRLARDAFLEYLTQILKISRHFYY